MFIDFHAYEASAGSGKTFSLVVRYLSLLFKGESAERILALTFTNKAASEMESRIIETISTLEDRGELAFIAENLGCTPQEILDKKEIVLERFLSASSKVMTLDKFFATILRKFSLHLGLMPTFSSSSTQHDLKVLSRFLQILKENKQEEELITLSHITEKRLVEIFALLQELYDRKNEMRDMHFTPVEVSPLVEKILEDAKALVSLFDLSSLSARACKTLEFDGVESILGKSWLFKESLQYWDFKKQYKPEMDILLDSLQKHVLYYIRGKEANFLTSLFSLLDHYIEAKMHVAKEDNELSFSDITYLVFELLRGNRIDNDFLYFRLDAQIDHILLDEFQDTSTLQYEILLPLLEELRSADDRSLFLVGDVKQSIYRFRGGKKELFSKVVEENGLQVDQLKSNYRSQKEIVEFVNRTFREKIKGYIDQEVQFDGGYVELVHSDEVLESTLQCVQRLLQEGASSSEIAILTATNANGDTIKELLQSNSIDVVTETSSLLINQKNVQALIEFLKYSYFGEEIYKRNFFALLNRDVGELRKCDFDHTLASEVKKLVDEMKLFDGDRNIISFIEHLGFYQDIEAFIYGYERLDAPGVQEELEGVRVLTVHKSKGLEYKHVIVIDRLGKKSADRSAIIYEYDGIRLENIYLRIKDRALLDEPYAFALEKEKTLSNEDELNALYVAFTRAEHTLFIVQKSKDSKFEGLDLEEQCYGTLTLQRHESVVMPSEKIIYSEKSYGVQEEIVKQEQIHELNHHAIQFGLALHYTLEMMRHFSVDSLNNALVSTKNRFRSLLDEEAFVSIERRITHLIDDKRFQLLLEGDIYKEKALSYEGELRYIDLLIDKGNEWIIVDYKSSKQYQESHVEQVMFYKRAITAITNSAVRAYIGYLLDEGIELVEI